MSKKFENHVPLPKETKAYICANCGAVSLDPNSICKVMGRGTKADWCGIKNTVPPRFCFNRKHNVRFRCNNCGQVSVNPELLCEPVEMEKPE